MTSSWKVSKVSQVQLSEVIGHLVPRRKKKKGKNRKKRKENKRKERKRRKRKGEGTKRKQRKGKKNLQAHLQINILQFPLEPFLQLSQIFHFLPKNKNKKKKREGGRRVERESVESELSRQNKKKLGKKRK